LLQGISSTPGAAFTWSWPGRNSLPSFCPARSRRAGPAGAAAAGARPGDRARRSHSQLLLGERGQARAACLQPRKKTASWARPAGSAFTRELGNWAWD